MKCYGLAGDVEYIVPIMLISIFEQLLLLCAVERSFAVPLLRRFALLRRVEIIDTGTRESSANVNEEVQCMYNH